MPYPADYDTREDAAYPWTMPGLNPDDAGSEDPAYGARYFSSIGSTLNATGCPIGVSVSPFSRLIVAR